MSALAYVENGKESHEQFYSSITKSTVIQYDYRAMNGKLFSCVAKTLGGARMKRDEWIKQGTK
jgi:hypothetical protein